MAHILIVDDDPALPITIPLVLERAGHRVTVAGDGQMATTRDMMRRASA